MDTPYSWRTTSSTGRPRKNSGRGDVPPLWGFAAYRYFEPAADLFVHARTFRREAVSARGPPFVRILCLLAAILLRLPPEGVLRVPGIRESSHVDRQLGRGRDSGPETLWATRYHCLAAFDCPAVASTGLTLGPSAHRPT